MDNKKTTDFGFKNVAWQEKTKLVGEIFHRVAGKYDLMNDLMSAGVHRLWKRFAIDLAAIRPGEVMLDLASGTGDLALRAMPRLGQQGQLILADINDSMLKIARDRFIDQGIITQVGFILANAEQLPFVNNSFDCITMAFGLRNVTDKPAALTALFSALKPGGRVIILEFSKPTSTTLEKIYDQYSFKILPLLGKVVLNDANSYQYLAESIRRHPDQETLKDLMLQAGFNQVDYHNLTGGVVAIHRGYKF